MPRIPVNDLFAIVFSLAASSLSCTDTSCKTDVREGTDDGGGEPGPEISLISKSNGVLGSILYLASVTRQEYIYSTR
jgi:hypothetical protein